MLTNVTGWDLAAAGAMVPAAPAGEGMTAVSLRILVIEDEATLRQVIARNISGRGHLVREAATASEAIKMAVASRPDLLLLDINLPDRSGWDVLRELRRRGIDVPTVVVSAVRVGQARLAEFRPLAYLPKPFPLEALLRIVEEVARAKKQVDGGDSTPSQQEKGT